MISFVFIRLSWLVLSLWLLAFGGLRNAKAQQSIPQIRQEINTYFPSNITRAINASRLRETLNDILDNVQADTISGTPPKTVYKWPSTSMFSAGIYGSSTNTSRYSIFSHSDGTEKFSVYYNQGYSRFATRVIVNKSVDSGEQLQVDGTSYLNGNTTIRANSADILFNGVNGVSRFANDLILRTFDSGTGGRIILQNGTFTKTWLHATNNGVNIGADADVHASAELQVTTTTKGFLLPRLTTTQVNAISSPAAGLMVYNTTLNKLCYYNGSSWRQVTDSAM